MKRLAILLSGRGSNFEVIARNVQEGNLPGEIAVVISNLPSAYGLIRARELGLNAISLPSKGHSRDEYDTLLIEQLRAAQPDLICLAGFMRLLSPRFVEAFRGRILNIHPSLLPAFPGLHAQKQAIDYGVKISGCTVHFVDEGLDSGPIILQAAVPVEDGDTEDTLSARILGEEHQLYSKAIKMVLAGEARFQKRRSES